MHPQNIIAEFAVFGLAVTAAGETVYAEAAGDYLAALIFGVAFQYLAVVPPRNLAPRTGIIAAFQADVLSLTSFEIGLFAWMALMNFAFFPAPHHLHPDSPVYWFLMQIGMVIGFVTAYHPNIWLIRRGIEEAMGGHQIHLIEARPVCRAVASS